MVRPIGSADKSYLSNPFFNLFGRLYNLNQGGRRPPHIDLQATRWGAWPRISSNGHPFGNGIVAVGAPSANVVSEWPAARKAEACAEGDVEKDRDAKVFPNNVETAFVDNGNKTTGRVFRSLIEALERSWEGSL